MFRQLSLFVLFTIILHVQGHRIKVIQRNIPFRNMLTITALAIKESNSIEDHINAPVHDSSIDHEAFLGIDESKTFDKLMPEESKIRLK